MISKGITDRLFYKFKQRRTHKVSLPKFFLLDATWIILLILLSISFSPKLNKNISTENVVSYYKSKYENDTTASSIYAEKIITEFSGTPIFGSFLKLTSSDALILMFSGNSDLSIAGLCLSFKDTLEIPYFSNKIGMITITVSVLILTAFLLIEFLTITHNLFTSIFNLHNYPTKSWFVYTLHDYIKNEVTKEYSITFKGYIKALLSFIPVCLLGFLLSHITGDFDLFIENPLVPQLLLLPAFLLFCCTGGLVIYVIQRAFVYLLLRLDINVLDLYIEEMLCAICGLLINIFIFNNSVVSTFTITGGIFLFVLISNNTARKNYIEEQNLNFFSVKNSYTWLIFSLSYIIVSNNILVEFTPIKLSFILYFIAFMYYFGFVIGKLIEHLTTNSFSTHPPYIQLINSVQKTAIISSTTFFAFMFPIVLSGYANKLGFHNNVITLIGITILPLLACNATAAIVQSKGGPYSFPEL